MRKIEFINDNAPYLSAENLNLLQENVEESIDEINKVIETDISSMASSYVTNITRAKIRSYGKVHHINIACAVSQSQCKIFDTPLRPAFTTELNLVTNNKTTARCIIGESGNIDIANISAGSETIYINGVVII